MDLSRIGGLTIKPSASKDDLETVETMLGNGLPTSYKELLRSSNGVATNEGVIIYGTKDLIERNETWETEVYAPGYIAIGDDSGGSVILMSQQADIAEILLVDSGDMTPEHASLVSHSLEEWIKSELIIDTNQNKEANKWPDRCRVVLVETLEGGIKDLLRIKVVFGLNFSTSELLKGSKNPPFVLIEDYPFGKAKKLIEELGELRIKLELV